MVLSRIFDSDTARKIYKITNELDGTDALDMICNLMQKRTFKCDYLASSDTLTVPILTAWHHMACRGVPDGDRDLGMPGEEKQAAAMTHPGRMQLDKYKWLHTHKRYPRIVLILWEY